MKILSRLRLLLRAALNDLFGEDGPFNENAPAQVAPGGQIDAIGDANGAADSGAIGGLLDETQARLDGLRVELGAALARQAECQAGQQAALAQAQALQAAVDQALSAGDEDSARQSLAQARQWEARARQIGERCAAAGDITARLRQAISAWEAHLEQARREYEDLLHRQRSAKALEELHDFQRRYRRKLSALQGDLERRKEAVARREDILAARDELEKLP